MTFKKQILNAQLINSIAEQEQAQKLYKLNGTSKNIERIDSSIKKFNRLRCLVLDFNYISTLQNLNSLFDLRQLHLQGNQLIKIQGLQTCKNLTLLNLASNKIEKIQKISHLTKLENLNLSKNKLQKINNLEAFKQLKILDLSNNHINALDSLPAFSKLEVLYLNHNKINKIQPNTFANSNKLLRLNLSHNLLVQCSFVSKLSGIEYLNVGFNTLQSFVLDVPLRVLEQLVLRNNQLDKIPSVGQYFPQLVILDISTNMFCSQHDLITSLSQNQLLTQLNFVHNPIHTKKFQETLLHLFKFDRLNGHSYNVPGTKYMQTMNLIQYSFKNQLKNQEEDQQDRKLRMSGFYNDQLENRMTGIKPHRAVSPTTKKAKAIINDNCNQIQKSFRQFIDNDKRINSLRQIYQKICEQNNIEKPHISPLPSQEQIYLTEQKSFNQITQDQKLVQLRLRHDNNQRVMREAKTQKQSKWQQLKARTKQRSFNIRKSRTKQVNGSITKFTPASTQFPKSKISSDLMKTQLNPRKSQISMIVQTAGKSGSTFYQRPSSQKKLSSKNVL